MGTSLVMGIFFCKIVLEAYYSTRLLCYIHRNQAGLSQEEEVQHKFVYFAILPSLVPNLCNKFKGFNFSVENDWISQCTHDWLNYLNKCLLWKAHTHHQMYFSDNQLIHLAQDDLIYQKSQCSDRERGRELAEQMRGVAASWAWMPHSHLVLLPQQWTASLWIQQVSAPLAFKQQEDTNSI